MKIGDKVRFLYTTGGGVIKGFQGKDIILVQDETGFEVPVLAKECVVIGNAEQVRSSNLPIENTIQQTPEPMYEYEETPGGEDISVHIAYLPNNLKQLSQSVFEAYLINDSNFFLYYTYLSKSESGWNLRAGGVVEPNTKIFVEEFNNTEINNLEHICLQCIPYKIDKPFELKQAISKTIRQDITKFFKVHCFRENDFFDEKAIILSLMINDQNVENAIFVPQELEKALKTKKNIDNIIPPKIINKKKNEIIEVDLHIHELLESTGGMSNTDILNYQLQTFNELLNQNKNKKGQKIVFIHGKGEGVLRNALIDELNKKHKSYKYQDASFREYGFGATMVIIN